MSTRIVVQDVRFAVDLKQYRCGVENLASHAVLAAGDGRTADEVIVALRHFFDAYEQAFAVAQERYEQAKLDDVEEIAIDVSACSDAAVKLAIAALCLWAMTPGTPCSACNEAGSDDGCDQTLDDSQQMH